MRSSSEAASPRGAWRDALGLNPNTAYRWVTGRQSKAPVFARVVHAKPESPTSTIAVKIGAVRVVVADGFDPDLLRAVVDALAGGAS
jgi:hypothetical protein